MNVHPNYRNAGILLKLFTIGTLLLSFITTPMYNIVAYVIVGVAFVQYFLAHLVQNGKRWTRYPVVALALLSLVFAVIGFTMNLVWIVINIACLAMQIGAIVLLFSASEATSEESASASSDDSAVDQ